MQSFVISLSWTKVLQVEKSIARYEKIESLLHSAINYDQIIMLESESLAESLKEGSENYTKNVETLKRISFYAEENSKKIWQARSLKQDLR